MPIPKNTKQLQRFLGVANFNRRFIPQYATICKPLTSILSDKAKFEWGDAQQQAFENVKKLLVNADNLALPEWSPSSRLRA